jgi:hypothetical protein
MQGSPPKRAAVNIMLTASVAVARPRTAAAVVPAHLPAVRGEPELRVADLLGPPPLRKRKRKRRFQPKWPRRETSKIIHPTRKMRLQYQLLPALLLRHLVYAVAVHPGRSKKGSGWYATSTLGPRRN